MISLSSRISLASSLLLLSGVSAFNPEFPRRHTVPASLKSDGANPNVFDNGCGGSYMNSLGALTDEFVPLAALQQDSAQNGGCGGTFMESLGALTDDLVPLARESEANNNNNCGGTRMNNLGVDAAVSQKTMQDSVPNNGCGGTFMQSLGALTDKFVPLARESEANNHKDCGGTYMNSVGVFPEQNVPLCKGMADPVNRPHAAVSQKSMHDSAQNNGCGGTFMESVGALTDKFVPLARESEANSHKDCGGTHMNNLGVFPEQYVPLCKGRVDPANTPDAAVYQKSTAFLDRYNREYERSLQRQEKAALSRQADDESYLSKHETLAQDGMILVN